MSFEFDPDKSRANKDKHGIDFEEAQALWQDFIVEMPAGPHPDEKRSLVVGKIEGKYWTAAITPRESRIRIISVRRARKKEIKTYEYHYKQGRQEDDHG